MRDKANLAAKLTSFTDQWKPRIVGGYNGNDVMVVRVEGAFEWHKHDDTDDLFLVLDGVLDIELRDRTIRLEPGELFVVPRASSIARSRARARSRCC